VRGKNLRASSLPLCCSEQQNHAGDTACGSSTSAAPFTSAQAAGSGPALPAEHPASAPQADTPPGGRHAPPDPPPPEQEPQQVPGRSLPAAPGPLPARLPSRERGSVLRGNGAACRRRAGRRPSAFPPAALREGNGMAATGPHSAPKKAGVRRPAHTRPTHRGKPTRYGRCSRAYRHRLSRLSYGPKAVSIFSCSPPRQEKVPRTFTRKIIPPCCTETGNEPCSRLLPN